MMKDVQCIGMDRDSSWVLELDFSFGLLLNGNHKDLTTTSSYRDQDNEISPQISITIWHETKAHDSWLCSIHYNTLYYQQCVDTRPIIFGMVFILSIIVVKNHIWARWLDQVFLYFWLHSLLCLRLLLGAAMLVRHHKLNSDEIKDTI